MLSGIAGMYPPIPRTLILTALFLFYDGCKVRDRNVRQRENDEQAPGKRPP